MSKRLEKSKNDEQETTIIQKVTAVCDQCDWQATGSLTIESNLILDREGLVEDCRKHHLRTKTPSEALREVPSDHHLFTLTSPTKKGSASVSSETAAGWLILQIEE